MLHGRLRFRPRVFRKRMGSAYGGFLKQARSSPPAARLLGILLCDDCTGGPPEAHPVKSARCARAADDHFHTIANEQKAADALEQGDGAALPRRADSRAERHARRCFPSSLPRLPPRERRKGNRIDPVMKPIGLHALQSGQRRREPCAFAGRRTCGSPRAWSPVR